MILDEVAPCVHDMLKTGKGISPARTVSPMREIQQVHRTTYCIVVVRATDLLTYVGGRGFVETLKRATSG